MKEHKEVVDYIFLPGVPGRKKDFIFMTGLRSKGLVVYEYRHPGLYDEAGEFSVSNTIENIELIFEDMEKLKRPFVVIAYSFSSLIIQKINISKYKYLRGVSLFSPVFGLGPDWIYEDFNQSIKQLIADNNCRPASGMEAGLQELMQPRYCFDGLDKLVNTGVPLSLFYSKNDSAINIKRLGECLQQYKELYGRGKIFTIEVDGGDHRIDSYYCDSIKNVLLSFVAREQVVKLLGNDCHIFIWGSSQITDFFKNGHSDIDLYVLSDNYLPLFSELSELQIQFKERFGIKLDLSVNNLSDLLSEKISRFNRGPILAHGVNQHFFSIDREKIKIDVDPYDVKLDCHRATLINYRESEKKISRLNGSSEQARRFVKLFTISVFYLLHVRGVNNVDMNNLDRWLDDEKDKEIIDALNLSRIVLRGKQDKLATNEWLKILKTIELILAEEESILGIKYNQYSVNFDDCAKVADTPGKSKVIILKSTGKVFKTYFIDSNEQIRDVERISQHANQLFFLKDLGISVPKNIELIENGSAIIMDYANGELLETLIKNESSDLKIVLPKLADLLFRTHKLFKKAKVDPSILIDSDELNYHCARNFKFMSLPNYMSLNDSVAGKKLKEIANKVNGILENTLGLLDKENIIYGDFKPENIVWESDKEEATILDPMLAMGKFSCDIGRIISRIMLANPELVNKELKEFIKKIKENYGEATARESQIMASMDMLNLFSRMIHTGDPSTKQKRMEEYATLLDKNTAVLLKESVC